MFEILRSLMTEIRPLLTNVNHPRDFAACLLKIEREIKRIITIEDNIEDVRHEVARFVSQIIVTEEPNNKQIFIDKINTLLDSLLETKSAARLVDEPIYDQEITDFPSESKETPYDKESYKRAMKAFIETPCFLGVTEIARGNLQAYFSGIAQFIQEKDTEQMFSICPIYFKNIIDILFRSENPAELLRVLIKRIKYVQTEAQKANDSCFKELINCLDKFLELYKPNNTTNVEDGYVTDDDEEYDVPVSSSILQRAASDSYSFSTKKASPVTFPFFMPKQSVSVIIKRIQELGAEEFLSWIKPISDLLEEYATPTSTSAGSAMSGELYLSTSTTPSNYSAMYLEYVINQLKNVHNKKLKLNLDSTSNFNDLMNAIRTNFFIKLLDSLDLEDAEENLSFAELIEKEIFGENDDSPISIKLAEFELQNEDVTCSHSR